MQDDPIDEGDAEDGCEKASPGEFLSDEERDLLVKRLAACGLPTREVIRITGASGRTVARTMQRWGIRRKRPDDLRSSRKGHARHLGEILGQYYELTEVTLDALDQLARENGLFLKIFVGLIREHVSPSRWAIRICLSCEQPALTTSPADRYCPLCKKKVKKARSGMEDSAIYE